jgi:multicomponent Na+:H+ antiporter subunit E
VSGSQRVVAGRRTDASRARQLRSRLPLALWLTLVWVGLWGQVTPANVLGGVAVATLLLLLLPLPATPGSGRLRPLPALGVAAGFAWELVTANVVVAAQVLRASTGLGRPLREAVVAVPVRGASDRLVTMVANMVSLTPGTLTLEIDRVADVLYVHVLDLDDPAELRRSVRAQEARVIRAFGSPAAVEALDREETS